MRRPNADPEKGQAAVEFVFALLFIVALASVLYQALFFELDVFNQMGVLRFKSVQRMRFNDLQYNNGFNDDSQTVNFKPLSQLTGYRVIFQTASTSMRYPAKRLSYKRGTAPALPGGLTTGILVVAGICIGTADHIESSSGNCVRPFAAISSALNSVP